MPVRPCDPRGRKSRSSVKFPVAVEQGDIEVRRASVIVIGAEDTTSLSRCGSKEAHRHRAA